MDLDKVLLGHKEDKEKYNIVGIIQLLLVLSILISTFMIKKYTGCISFEMGVYIDVAIFIVFVIYYFKFFNKTIVYFIFAILLSEIILGGGIIINSNSMENEYEKYISGENIKYELLNYKDTFEQWNNKNIGNDVNVLLLGGRILEKDNGIIISSKNILGSSNNIVIENASYINRYDNYVIYRNDIDRHIYIQSLNDNDIREIGNGNCGEVFVANDKVYFIDFDNNAGISYIDLKNGEVSECVVNDNVIYFAVCGDNIIYLNNKQELFYVELEAKKSQYICNGVERFFLNGDIIIESGNKIIKCSPVGDSSEVVYQSMYNNMDIVGISNKNIYILEDRRIKSLDGDTDINSDDYILRVNMVTKDKNGNLIGEVYNDEFSSRFVFF